MSAQNRPQVAPKTQLYPARASRSWSPGQALIEFDLRWWLGGRRPRRIDARRWRRRDGLPQRGFARRGEARRPRGFAEAIENLAHSARLGDEREDAHLGVTEPAGQIAAARRERAFANVNDLATRARLDRGDLNALARADALSACELSRNTEQV